MFIGDITGYIDVAQVVLYAFWLFFAGLILYLRMEDKREGYPLDSDRSRNSPVVVEGFPPMPAPKTYLLRDGSTSTLPNHKPEPRDLHALAVGAFPGAPLNPPGPEPLREALGPASYAERADEPDLTVDGIAKIVPLRVATDFYLDRRDPDPRGMEVRGADGAVAGVVTDVWVDRSEVILRYLEVGLTLPGATHTVLVPSALTRIDRRRRMVKVKSITAAQFAGIPTLRHPDRVTLLEEDRIMAYVGGGHLYATPMRTEPAL